MLKKFALTAVMAVAAAGASATTTNWAAHDPFEFGAGFAVGSGNVILDFFEFTLTEASTLKTTAVTNDLGVLNLAGSTVFLYSGTVDSGSFISGFSFDSVQTASTITPIAAGTYYYKVQSTVAAGAQAGSYTLTSQVSPVSPVPEPETYALFLAGIGAVGFVVARRRNAS